jgi:hypothetical protein
MHVRILEYSGQATVTTASHKYESTSDVQSFVVPRSETARLAAIACKNVELFKLPPPETAYSKI